MLSLWPNLYFILQKGIETLTGSIAHGFNEKNSSKKGAIGNTNRRRWQGTCDGGG